LKQKVLFKREREREREREEEDNLSRNLSDSLLSVCGVIYAEGHQMTFFRHSTVDISTSQRALLT
jgi:hypothetical protein